MLTILRLVRLPNLLIIAFTMYLTRYCLLIEFDAETHKFININYTLNNAGFGLLVLATVMIAAAGYIINDYFDTRIDAINKPEKLIIGVKVSRRMAMFTHVILSTLGILIGFYLAYNIHHIKLGFINIITVTALWFYSRSFKKRFLIGNVIVSILSGLIPVIVTLFEPNIYKELYYFIAGYAIFAFIISLVREIIKDLEDIEGDMAENCKTLPIILGVRPTKTIVILLMALIIALTSYVLYLPGFASSRMFILYAVFAVQIPLLVLIYLTISSRSKRNYHVMSLLTKGVMFTGVLSMYIFYYCLNH